MTIMVALSQVIPLSDFNVALGYNLSHPQQVLPAHIRTHLSAHTHSHMHAQARKHTHTHNVFLQLQQMFRSVHMCHRYSVCVRVYISFIQKSFSAVQRQVQHEDILYNLLTNAVFHHTHRHTQNQKHIDKLTLCFSII